MSRVNCSVYGCYNSYSNTTKEIKFYSFPAKAQYAERKEAWIRYARRNCKKTDGPEWTPPKDARICSEHFLGNRKNDHPNSPSYNPTVSELNMPLAEKFPLPIVSVEKELRLSPFQIKFRQSVLDKSQQQLLAEPEVESEPEEADGITLKKSKLTQTKYLEYQKFGPLARWDLFVGPQSDNHGEISTQVNHEPIVRKDVLKKQKAEPASSSSSSSSSAPGLFSLVYESLTPDRLYQLTLTSDETFKKILRLMDNFYYRCAMNKENCLLLFLIELKSAMSFSMLASFFDKDPSTVERIFTRVLRHLVLRSQCQNSWYPSATTEQQLVFPKPQIVDRKIKFAFQSKKQKTQQQLKLQEDLISPELLIYKIRLFDIVKNPLNDDLVNFAEDIVRVCCLIVYLQIIPTKKL